MSEKRKRRKWTAGEKLRIVLAGLDGSVEISELCRREGINELLSKVVDGRFQAAASWCLIPSMKGVP